MRSGNVVRLSPRRKLSSATGRSRKRLFYLGGHSYLGAPGQSWSTDYWVKRLGKGEHWELLCNDPEASGQRISAGTYSPDELRDYFDSVAFHVPESLWASIGLGRSAQVISISGEDEA